MRSSVDLPQPEGPTKTTNSPSLDAEVDAVDHLGGAEALDDLAELELSHARPPRFMASSQPA